MDLPAGRERRRQGAAAYSTNDDTIMAWLISRLSRGSSLLETSQLR